MEIDLHCHSTASDGALAPAALVARAFEKGVRVLALTDHDTLEGLEEARAAALALNMTLVNGIELSCTWGGATIHVLGYGFDLNAPARPHFADYLVEAGYVKDRAEAFRKWLGAGKLGDVKQHWPTLEETVDTLRAAGAWVSLAHPSHYDFTRSKRRRLIGDYIQAGGHAIEVVNGYQPADQVGSLAILAREFGLLVSAGSDFHGPGGWSEIGEYRPIPEDLPPLWCRFKYDKPTANV